MDYIFSSKGDVVLFHTAKQIRKQNQDIVGEECVKDVDNKLVYSDAAKKNVWKQHYQCLLNIEFPWDETSLSQIEPSIGPAPFVTANMVLMINTENEIRRINGPFKCHCGNVKIVN